MFAETEIHVRCRQGSSSIEDAAVSDVVVMVEGGAGESSYWWDGIQEELSEAGLTVCTYDRPGYRQSNSPPHYNTPDATRSRGAPLTEPNLKKRLFYVFFCCICLCSETKIF